MPDSTRRRFAGESLKRSSSSSDQQGKEALVKPVDEGHRSLDHPAEQPGGEQREDHIDAPGLDTLQSAGQRAAGRQQVGEHAPAIQRRNRQQVEHRDDDVEQQPEGSHSRQPIQVGRIGDAGFRQPPHGHHQQAPGQRHQEIGGRSRRRHLDPIRAEMAETVGIDGDRFCPAEQEGSTDFPGLIFLDPASIQ